MKSVHGGFATLEDRQKLKVVNSTTYSKDDYLTPVKAARKFNITTEEATNIMKKLIFKNATIVLNGHKSPVVVKMGTGTPRLHPLALDIFQEALNKQKEK